jgi:Ca2+-binding EF-hand superfamily protein
MSVKPSRVVWSAALATLLVPALASAQWGGPPGGGDRGGDRGGRGMRSGDPNQFFDRLAQGRDVIIRSQLDPRMAGMLDRFGIQGEQITRQQFTDAMQRFRDEMQRNGGGYGRGPGGPGGPPSPGGPSPAPPGPPGSPPAPGSYGGDSSRWGRDDGGSRWGRDNGPSPDMIAEWRFRQYDKRGDGKLTADEVPDDLKAEFKKWDTNDDGFIELSEFKAFEQARWQQRMQERDWGSGGPPNQDEEKKPPTFYRAGKLPKEVPAWFAEYDTNQDAQVDLAEWRKAGKSVKEFEEMDRNGDGVLSVEEVLRYVRLNAPKSEDGVAVAAADAGGRGGYGGGRGGFGGDRSGFGGGRPGPGGDRSGMGPPGPSGGDATSADDSGGKRDPSNRKDRSFGRGGPGGGRGFGGGPPGGGPPGGSKRDRGPDKRGE